MSNAHITLTGKAAHKWPSLSPETQQELVDIMHETVLTMPDEPIETPPFQCHSKEQNTSDTSKRGSTRTSKPPFKARCQSPVILALTLLSWLFVNTSSASLVDNRLLEAVSLVESNGRNTALGDVDPETGKARAKGAYQFWRPTWDHVSQIRQRAGLSTTSYKDGASHPAWSREYARTYLKWIEDYLRGRGVHTPTRSQIYAGYNWGVGSFRKVGFDINKAPATTRRAAQRIENYCKQR